MKLRFTSCQAPNAEGHVKRIVEYLGNKLGIDFEYVDGMDWKSREAALHAGDIQVGWICGLPYVIHAGNPEPSIELLAAPVMAGERYRQQPVYFSDVIVRREEAVKDFADLRSKVWAYNEPHSHSGYNITRFMLAQKKLSSDFFGEIVEAGSHERALKLLLRGKIYATALDSTVLETEIRNDPHLADRIRILESWGPSPIPPWVIHRSLDRKVAITLRDAMVSMNSNAEGKSILDADSVSRFTQVVDSDYDRIREMYFKGQSVSL
jgi:phosphonate transport system substrate-binding protein